MHPPTANAVSPVWPWVATPAAPAPVGAKLLIAVMATAINAIVYFVPNHALVERASLLPWTRVDTAIPFVQSTLWIYFSDYFLVASAFMLSRTWAEVVRFVRAYFALLLTGATIHFLFPTAFPREAFPVMGDDFTARALLVLRHVDLPTSCLPSMHVASSFLAAFALWRHRPLFLQLWTLWATLVAISTLTLKQHYAVDVGAGLLMAGLFWAAFFYWPEVAGTRPQSPQSPQSSGRTLASTAR